MADQSNRYRELSDFFVKTQDLVEDIVRDPCGRQGFGYIPDTEGGVERRDLIKLVFGEQ